MGGGGGCNVLEHSMNPLGSLSLPCGFGIDFIEGSYPTLFSPPTWCPSEWAPTWRPETNRNISH